MAIVKSADARSASDRALTPAQLKLRLRKLPGWVAEGKTIRQAWTFKDHYQAMAFANAIAWISHEADHHPDMQVSFNRVNISYSTHSSGGVSEKDLICAARILQLN